MKTQAIVAALALAFAGTAFAQEASYDYPQPSVVSKTRADVLAEVAQARADGTLQVTEADWPKQSFVSTRTRAEVRAETLSALADPAWRELSRESNAFSVTVAPVRAAQMALVN